MAKSKLKYQCPCAWAPIDKDESDLMCDWAADCFEQAVVGVFGNSPVNLCAKHWLVHRKNHTEVGAKPEPAPTDPCPAALDFAEFVRRRKALPPDKQQDVAMWIQSGEWRIPAESDDICGREPLYDSNAAAEESVQALAAAVDAAES